MQFDDIRNIDDTFATLARQAHPSAMYIAWTVEEDGEYDKDAGWLNYNCYTIEFVANADKAPLTPEDDEAFEALQDEYASHLREDEETVVLSSYEFIVEREVAWTALEDVIREGSLPELLDELESDEEKLLEVLSLAAHMCNQGTRRAEPRGGFDAVRLLIAEHELSDAETLEKTVETNAPEVKAAIINHPNAPQSLVDQLLATADDALRGALLNREDTPLDRIALLAHVPLDTSESSSPDAWTAFSAALYQDTWRHMQSSDRGLVSALDLLVFILVEHAARDEELDAAGWLQRELETQANMSWRVPNLYAQDVDEADRLDFALSVYGGVLLLKAHLATCAPLQKTVETLYDAMRRGVPAQRTFPVNGDRLEDASMPIVFARLLDHLEEIGHPEDAVA
ncbi:hypothetical protein [Deinococcus yavapaiensis]|uniref:Uncharacterized protein n=1 Tax=Deinococcus yavapaiensis KR-236 TaxID=694435 RepID=A0A318S4N3_9DEIO|nr:hypothetical protein [Deinococcus yavapaiensis]PYE52028.1 hypothetical protein DES52_11374 [Deinococcus yavapaiensis KR-236]